MRASTIFSAFSALAVFSFPALAADWQAVASKGGEQVDIDKARIMRAAPGQTVAWSRLVLGREVKGEGGAYTAVHVMNRYDCEARRFATLRRIYVNEDLAIREDKIASPKEVGAAAGSVEEKLLAEACKLRTVGEAEQVAEAAVQALSGKPGVMYADVRKADESPTARAIPVADAGKPELKTEPRPEAAAEAKQEAKPEAVERPKSAAETKIEIRPPSERPRFIGLPKVDRPESASAAASATTASPKPGEQPAQGRAAAKSVERSVSASVMSDRHERERQYATTGPRRAPAARQKTEETAPLAIVQHKEIPWSYEGEGGPANWGKLRSDYGLCATGRRQSPIDIREGIRVDLESIKFDYRPTHFRIVDTGHTIEVHVGEGSTMSIMGRTYRLVEFHFHRPSEERINGKTFDMVVHFSHRDDEGRLAMIAVLLDKGNEHPLIQTLWNNMPLEVNQDVTPAVAIDPNALLPESRGYYTYMGSLTTPPCTEDVLWMVFKQPMQISAEQIGIFSRLYRNNARPTQPANNRLVKENR